VGLDDSSGGLSNGAYTILNNTRLDRGNSTINRPNIFVANAIWNLPKLSDANPFVRGALGGWEFSTITTAENGNSITVFATVPTDANGGRIGSMSGTGFTNNERPNIVPGSSCNSGQKFDQILNPNAFTWVGYVIGGVGDEQRGYCRAPNNVDFDLALYKNFQPLEHLRVQFRLDAFNAFNHANFRGDNINANWLAGGTVTCGNPALALPCSPTNNVISTYTPPTSTSNFGQSTLTRGPREIQYGIRFTF
jgi:hypothetical protein